MRFPDSIDRRPTTAEQRELWPGACGVRKIRLDIAQRYGRRSEDRTLLALMNEDFEVQNLHRSTESSQRLPTWMLTEDDG